MKPSNHNAHSIIVLRVTYSVCTQVRKIQACNAECGQTGVEHSRSKAIESVQVTACRWRNHFKALRSSGSMNSLQASRASGRTEWSLKRLWGPVRAELVKARAQGFEIYCLSRTSLVSSPILRMVSIRIHVVSERIPSDGRYSASSGAPYHEELFQMFSGQQLHQCGDVQDQLVSAGILIA
jgi:hypothetical protein